MKPELTIEVNARLTVSDDTAERCLRILELWQADNPDKVIEGKEVLTDKGRMIIFRIRQKGDIEKDGQTVQA